MLEVHNNLPIINTEDEDHVRYSGRLVAGRLLFDVVRVRSRYNITPPCAFDNSGSELFSGVPLAFQRDANITPSKLRRDVITASGKQQHQRQRQQRQQDDVTLLTSLPSASLGDS